MDTTKTKAKGFAHELSIVKDSGYYNHRLISVEPSLVEKFFEQCRTRKDFFSTETTNQYIQRNIDGMGRRFVQCLRERMSTGEKVTQFTFLECALTVCASEESVRNIPVFLHHFSTVVKKALGGCLPSEDCVRFASVLSDILMEVGVYDEKESDKRLYQPLSFKKRALQTF